MTSETQAKKDNEAQLSLYRLMRLQNRQNNFVFKDQAQGVQFRVSYQHFPLETLPQHQLLKTFWKLVTTHYFKKINIDQQYRLECIKKIFASKNSINKVPSILSSFSSKSRIFWNQMSDVLSSDYLTKLSKDFEQDREDRIWIKRLFLECMNSVLIMPQKSKKICKTNVKIKSGGQKKNKKRLVQQQIEQQKQLDQQLQYISCQKFFCSQQQSKKSKGGPDWEIQQLQRQLLQTQNENQQLLNKIQLNYQQQDSVIVDQQAQNNDLKCLQWLIHSLQQKQISESISKITKCQKWGGQYRFNVHYQSAMNLLSQQLTQQQLKKINNQREISLFKFYKTGVKSLYSYICHNFAGLAQLQSNRMCLTKNKDKDYLQVMKKNIYNQPSLTVEMQHYDTCHHCKCIYPQYMLTGCRFTSDRQTMPKTNQGQSQFNSQIQTCNNHSRTSQRHITKNRNCFNGYAKINDQYVCGRKYCKGCIKDNYGKDWFKLNHGICPFCEAVCSCTRCLRNQKINKLKSFFVSLGGNINQLQQDCLLSKMMVKKDQIQLKIRPRQNQTPRYRESVTPTSNYNRYTKSKIICKQAERGNHRLRNQNKVRNHQLTRNNYSSRPLKVPKKHHHTTRGDAVYKNHIIEEQVEKTSALTGQKQLNSLLQGRRQSRRMLSGLY